MAGEERFVGAEHSAYSFDPRAAPVLEVEPGTIVTFQTADLTARRLAAGETAEGIGLESLNAVTGPVAVRGAQPGDALRLDVLEIAIESAWSFWLPGFGPLGELTRDTQVRELELEDGQARIGAALSVPLEPMIGCIGVAPTDGTCSTLQPAYPWGGNLDLRELSPGATLFLPVQVPGALLSVGDLHAAMGSGEPTHVSLEAAGRAMLRLGLERDMSLPSPRLRSEGNTICVGLGGTLEEAQQAAVGQAFELLTALGLESFDAYAYLSARVGLRLGGPASPMVLAVVPDP